MAALKTDRQIGLILLSSNRDIFCRPKQNSNLDFAPKLSVYCILHACCIVILNIFFLFCTNGVFLPHKSCDAWSQPIKSLKNENEYGKGSMDNFPCIHEYMLYHSVQAYI